MKKLKVLIINISKKNKLFRKLVRKTNMILKKIKYLYYYVRYNIDEKTILFEAFGGRNYT